MTRRGDAAAGPDRVVLTGGPLAIAEVVAVARGRVPVELAELRAVTEKLGGTAGLIDELDGSSRELLELAGRLDDDQGARQVPVRILDGEELRVDQPLPVASLLTIQARRHLPLHEAQLGALLGPP